MESVLIIITVVALGLVLLITAGLIQLHQISRSYGYGKQTFNLERMTTWQRQ